MNANALRTWGLAVGAVLMTAALAIAAMGPETAPTQELARTQTLFETAQTAAEPVSFLVRFRGSGPIARAQASAAQGNATQARRVIETQLVRQTAFTGLCFDRFTAGAAEVVLRSCEPVAAGARDGFARDWLARLRAMRPVEYADENATAAQNSAPG